MKTHRSVSTRSYDRRSWRRPPKAVAPRIMLVLAVGALTGCGASKASSSSTGGTPAPSIQAGANQTIGAGPPVTLAAVPAQFLQQSGYGNKTLVSVALPASWTVTWAFTCTDPAKGPFSLTSSVSGGSPVSITAQTGLGGGGHKPLSGAGTYTFVVTTTCGWKVSVGDTPAVS